MTTVKRTLAALSVIAVCCGLPLSAQTAPQSPSPSPTQTTRPQQEQQNEFVPIDQLPPQEQLPAARLLVIAYAFVMGALFIYVISVARRLGNVRREVERLEAEVKRSGRA